MLGCSLRLRLRTTPSVGRSRQPTRWPMPTESVHQNGGGSSHAPGMVANESAGWSLSMPAQAPFSAGRVAWTAADTRLAGAVIPAQQHATHLTILDL